MKRQILSVIAAVFTAITVSAQISEGHVKYSIEMTSDNPEMAMGIAMMQGSTLDLYFKGTKSRSEMTMGSLMTTVVISDADKKESLTLMSGMMGNTAYRSSIEDEAEESEETPDMEITVTEETKVILGYTCKKAIMTDEEGNESVFWVTEEIEANKEGQTMLNNKIPGFPLQMEVLTNGMTMSITALEFAKKIKDKKLFDMVIPDGYTETTQEELMQEFEGQ